MKWVDKLRLMVKRRKRDAGFRGSRYEDLVSQLPLYHSVTPHEIHTVNIERVLHKEEAEILGDDGIRDLFAREFAEYLKDHMLITVRCDPYGYTDLNGVHYVGELKIAIPKTST